MIPEITKTLSDSFTGVSSKKETGSFQAGTTCLKT
jgi:hypothetical protein